MGSMSRKSMTIAERILATHSHRRRSSEDPHTETIHALWSGTTKNQDCHDLSMDSSQCEEDGGERGGEGAGGGRGGGIGGGGAGGGGRRGGGRGGRGLDEEG